MTKQYEQFLNNIERVDSFLTLYSDIKESKISDANKDYKFTDILRATVVFLHSSFEDYFRNVLIEQIPIVGDEKTIKEMALPGKGKNAGKLYLDDLVQYQNLTVKELIKESVKSTMNSRSFNNYSDIHNWAQSIGVNLSSFKMVKDINDAIDRRHKIVHEADTYEGRLTGIRADQVTRWKNTMCILAQIIDEQIEKNNSELEGTANG